MGTLLVGLCLLFMVAAIVRSMIKAKKSGKSIKCGCDCKNCPGHCR